RARREYSCSKANGSCPPTPLTSSARSKIGKRSCASCGTNVRRNRGPEQGSESTFSPVQSKNVTLTRVPPVPLGKEPGSLVANELDNAQVALSDVVLP